MHALVKPVPHKLGPELRVDQQLGLAVVQHAAVVAHETFGEALDIDDATQRFRVLDRFNQVGLDGGVRHDQVFSSVSCIGQ